MMNQMADQTIIPNLQTVLLGWFRRDGRELPWRATMDPYAILVSEMMLQQTQVSRVIPHYAHFLTEFPDIQTLADTSLDDVLRAWIGLGYNRRAVRLRETARKLILEYSGQIPSGPEELVKLPGIGKYTANAVACFAFKQNVVVIDTNIRRVLGRICQIFGQIEERLLEDTARAFLPPNDASSWNQALMDLGATICHPRLPSCHECPIQQFCATGNSSYSTPIPSKNKDSRTVSNSRRFKGSNRYYRGLIINYLAHLKKYEWSTLATMGIAIKSDYSENDKKWLESIILELESEKLLQVRKADGGINLKDNIISVSLSTD